MRIDEPLAKALDKGAYALGYAGQTIVLRFRAWVDDFHSTEFFIDDVDVRLAP